MAELTFRPVSAHDAEPLGELFERAGCPCYCRYWHFDGDTDSWLARSHLQPEQNAAELRQAIACGDSRMQGTVAVDRGWVRGWLKLTPAADVQKLYRQRPYRALLELPRQDVWTVGCMLVDPAWRERGLAHGLLAAAVQLARARGAAAIEAFPRIEQLRGRPETVFTGPRAVFERAGFVHHAGTDPYPVLRLSLAHTADATQG